MPNITPHVCRHTYCSNQAKAGMNPKTLQYLMGHSDIGVTMNVYTHLGLEDAEEELRKMEEFRKAQAAVEQKERKPVTHRAFKVVLKVIFIQLQFSFSRNGAEVTTCVFSDYINIITTINPLL